MLSVNRPPAIDVWCHYLQIGYELEQWPFWVPFPLPPSLLHVVRIKQLGIKPQIFISVLTCALSFKQIDNNILLKDRFLCRNSLKKKQQIYWKLLRIIYECKNVPLNITINHQQKCYFVFSTKEIWQIGSNLQPHFFADVANGIQRKKKVVLEGGDRRSALLTSVSFLGGARRTESVVPRSQLKWGGASSTERERLSLPSCWERWRYQQISVCSATLQIFLLQIVSDWGNSTWLGFWNDYWWQCPSGAAFINVPINFTCPALFCFH